MPEEIVPPEKTAPDATRLLDRLYEAELFVRNEEEALAFLLETVRSRREHARALIGGLPPAARISVEALTVTEDSLRPAARRLVARALELDATFARLCTNYDGSMLDMAVQGRGALRNGARNRGRERGDELRDAARLLKFILDHPIGARNFAVWFDMGWILWKLGAPSEEAIEAFYQASRLSGADRDALHVYALRHLAYLQGLQGHFEEAYATAQRVLNAGCEDPEAYLEAARFAARTDRRTEAARLVDHALESDITLLFGALSEPDLAVVHATATGFLERRVAAARQDAAEQIARWHFGIQKIRDAASEIGVAIPLREDLAAAGEREISSTLGLFELQALRREAAAQGDGVFAAGKNAIADAVAQAREAAGRLKKQIDRLHDDRAYWEGSLRKLEDDAKVAGYSLHPYNWENPLRWKKNARAKEARAFYAQCKANMDSLDGLLRDQLPMLQADYDLADARRARIEQIQSDIETAARS